MGRIRSLLLLLLGALMLLPACAPDGVSQEKSAAAIGGTAAALATALLPRQMGKDVRALITVGAVTGGALIGRQVGRYLDAQDRERMNASAQQALDTGQVQTWSNPDTGTAGRVVSSAAPASSGPNCRILSQTVTFADGRQEAESVTTCRGRDGWESR
jgi:surface antigen